jgi:hypothetical protein
MQTNFLLGTLKLTEAARLLLKRQPYDLVARHAINEHGAVSAKELQQNINSLRTNGPIISRYRSNPLDPASPFVVVNTKATWGETVISVE